MAITEQEYYKKAEESIPQYNERIAGLRAANKPQPTVAEEVMDEPTAITSGTINNDVVPELQKKLDTLSETDQATLEDEERKKDLETDITSIDTGTYSDSTTKLAAEMKDALDRQTKAEIERISSQYSQYRRQQEDMNKRFEASTQTSLLLGGAARYSVSSDGIMQAQVEHGLSKIKDINDQEQSLISAARAAQVSGNYRLMSEQIAHIEDVRKQKTSEAQALAKSLAKINEEQREKALKSVKEQAIAGLYDEGITAATDMQFYLKQLGMDADLKEIDDALKIINPPENLTGLSADLKTAKYVYDNPDIFPEMKGMSLLDIRQALLNKNNVEKFETRSIGGDLYELEKDMEGKVIGTRLVEEAKTEPTGSEREAYRVSRAIKKARPALEQSLGEDGYADPRIYLSLRSDYAEAVGDPSEFDDVFASLLSPQERARLGLGKATGVKATDTANDELNFDNL